MSSKKEPLVRAEKIPRGSGDAHFLTAGGNIAAIDFGTTSVSLAYSTLGDNTVNTFKFETKERIPNAILLKREPGEKGSLEIANGGSTVKVTVDSFGTSAQQKFTKMRDKEYQNYIYFERIKMLMRRDKKISRETQVESFSEETFYLVEVIAFILKYVKDLLIDHLSRTAKPLKTTDFDWVITVPAIWDARGKRMMREAAYLAGLLTDSDGISRFTPISNDPLPSPPEINPSKLTLALEPEAAALYSQQVVSEEIERAGNKAAIVRPSQYMVIDIGGGTVDITAHIERDGGIVVENIPTGNAWGGTKVNEAFSEMFQNIVNDPGFHKFKSAGSNRAQQSALINRLLYNEFEDQKILFGECKSDTITIELKNKLANFYDKALTSGVKRWKDIEYDNDSLYIEKETVESQFLSPAIDGIIDCVLKAIEENKCVMDTFYLVGGFGGCKYVHQKVKSAIEHCYKERGLTCVIIPPSPTIAVAQGAAMWRRDPGKLKARKADATYGLSIVLPFDHLLHDPKYWGIDRISNEIICKSVFQVFLLKGELAHSHELIHTTAYPSSNIEKRLIIDIYSTNETDVQYTKDTSGNPTVTQIGQLVIDIPNPLNLSREERCVDVTIDFSGTEIQAKARYSVTGDEVNTVCDFLSIV